MFSDSSAFGDDNQNEIQNQGDASNQAATNSNQQTLQLQQSDPRSSAEQGNLGTETENKTQVIEQQDDFHSD